MNLSLRPMADALKQQVDEHGFIDVGDNIEQDLPISKRELYLALAMLKEEGYQVHILRARHLASSEKATMRVLVGPDVTQKDTWINREKIRLADFTQQ
jgi:biotin operon repressor